MMKKVLLLCLAGITLSSCVSKKVFEDLESKYARLRKENKNLSSDLASAKKDLAKMTADYEAAAEERNATKSSLTKYKTDYESAQAQLAALQTSYDALEANSSASNKYL